MSKKEGKQTPVNDTVTLIIPPDASQDAPVAIQEPNAPNKIIPLAKLIDLREKNLTYEEIGKIVGRDKATVWERLQPYELSIDNLQTVKDRRADTLTVLGDNMLSSLTPDDIQKSSAYQRVGMAGLLHNMERLERDKSTANIAHVHEGLTGKISDLEKRIAENRAQLGMMPAEEDDEDTA